MVITAVYHFVDSNLGVEMSLKKGLTEKEGVLEVVLPRREQVNHLGKGLPVAPGVGANYTD